MIKLVAKKGKEKHPFTLPESANEMTLEQFCNMLTAPDEMARLSILTGLPQEVLKACDDDTLLEKVYIYLGWLDPTALVARLEKETVPDWCLDIEQYTLGQKIEAKQLMQGAAERQEPKIATFVKLLEIYAPEKADGIELPEGYAAANYFFLRWHGLRISGHGRLSLLRQLRRLKRALKGSRSSQI
jgi:hypothetical protein